MKTHHDIIFASDFMGIQNRDHANIRFVNVLLDTDTPLFIDPCLLELAEDAWSRGASMCVQTYFDELFQAMRTGDEIKMLRLYSHGHEINSTKLGYGRNGRNGKAKTPYGMKESFRELERLALQIPTLGKASDIPVFVQRYDKDCLSDLLTNILHLQLNQFTSRQMKIAGRKPDGMMVFSTWSSSKKRWVSVNRPCWKFMGKELLLVPKWIVRKNYLFKAHQFLYTVVIDRNREENQWQDISKRDIWKNLQRDSQHWEYEYVKKYTCANPKALSEYHDRIPRHYSRKYGRMTDQELDLFVLVETNETKPFAK